jgi:hypothetical protein
MVRPVGLVCMTARAAASPQGSFLGKPPADANKLMPLEPDRAGVRTSWLTSVLRIFKIVAAFPGMIANRSSVVDPRVKEV